jgi:polar amino acid transport system substrate-binding protein
MARLIGYRSLLCTTIAVVWALSGRASPAEPLRLVTAPYLGPSGVLNDDNAPGLAVEVFSQVFAAMGQEITIESFPPKRALTMMARDERDGMPGLLRTGERERFCSFPDEPLAQGRFVLFVRTADIGTLKFSSSDDLVGHDIAVIESLPKASDQPASSLEMWEFLREHHSMIETGSNVESLRLLTAGRVDYAVVGINLGMREIARMGLSGKIEPLLSRSVMEADVSICFSKARVSLSFVEAFSRALRRFKQTEAFQVIYHKYFP